MKTLTAPAPKKSKRNKAAVRQQPPPRPVERDTPDPVARHYHGPVPLWYRSPYKYLFSLKVGIFLLVVLTIASIIGTLIDPLEKAQAMVYYTWWFKLLLLALAINMSCSTVHTIVKKIMPLRGPRFQHHRNFYRDSTAHADVEFFGASNEVAEKFRAEGFDTWTEGSYGYARTGWWGRWGAPISHVGLVLVLMGGFLSSWLAKEGWIQVVEGGTTSELTLRTDPPQKAALGFQLTVNDFDTDFFPRTRIPSHFVSNITTVEPNGQTFSGDVEVNSSPKVGGWRIHQTSYQEIPQLKRFYVTITHPGLAEPINAQLSAGQEMMLAGIPDTKITLRRDLAWFIEQGGAVVSNGNLGDGGHGGHMPNSITVVRFEPDFIMGPEGISSRGQELNNPAVQISLGDDMGHDHRQWLFKREDMKAFSHNPGGPLKIDFVDVQEKDGEFIFGIAAFDTSTGLPLGLYELKMNETSPIEQQEEPALAATAPSNQWDVTMTGTSAGYATVLSLTRNPLIPFIYFGCGLMMLGLMVAFFIRRREVWWMIDEENQGLLVAARYRLATEELDPKTMKVLSELNPQISAEPQPATA